MSADELPQEIWDAYVTERLAHDAALLAKARDDVVRLNLDPVTAARVVAWAEKFLDDERRRTLRFGRGDDDEIH